MIFSDELDKSLFLIIKNDKRCRKEIIDFLQGIPKSLMKDLKNEILNIQNVYDDIGEIMYPSLSKEYISKNNNIYSYKYDNDVDELLLLKRGIDNETTILTLSSYNRYIGRFYNIKVKNNRIEKKEYSYGIRETKDRKLFYKTDETRDISVPIIKEIKESKKIKSLKLNDLKKVK